MLSALNAAARIAIEAGDPDGARVQFAAINKRAAEIGSGDWMASAAVNLGVAAFESGDFEAGLAHSAEGAEMFRELGDDGGVATALVVWGMSVLLLGDAARADGAFREALVISSRLGWKRGLITAATGLGAALVAEREEEDGVELLAAAASLSDESGIGLDWHPMEDRAARALANAKAALGEEVFAAAWARGQTMTVELVALAGAG